MLAADGLVGQHDVALPGLPDHHPIGLHLDLTPTKLPAEHLQPVALVANLKRLRLNLRGVFVHAVTLPALWVHQKTKAKTRTSARTVPPKRAKGTPETDVPFSLIPEGMLDANRKAQM